MKLNNTFEITNTTQSTTKDTGCLVLEGGLGVEKNLNVGEQFNALGDSTIGSLGITTNFQVSGISTFTMRLTLVVVLMLVILTLVLQMQIRLILILVI